MRTLRVLLSGLFFLGLHSTAVGDEPSSKPLVDQLGDPLPAGAVARMGTVRFRQPDFVRSLAFAPDGKTLLSGGNGVRLWDTATGRPLGRLADLPKREHIDGGGLAFAPEGKTAACAGFAGIATWDVATRKLLSCGIAWAHLIPEEEAPQPEGSPANPDAETFSPDTKRLAWINPDGSISLWETATVKEIDVFGKGLWLKALAFSPDGKRLAAVGGATVYIWDATKRRDPSKTKPPKLDPCRIRFLPDGKNLLLAGRDGAMSLWNVETLKETRRLGQLTAEPLDLAVSPDGKLIAGSDRAGVVQLHETATGKQLGRFHVGEEHFGTLPLTFSPDSRLLAVGCANRIHLWDVGLGKEVGVREQSDAPVMALILAPDGKGVIPLHRDAMYRGQAGWDNSRPEDKRPASAEKRTVSPDGRMQAISRYHDDCIHLHDTDTGDVLRRLPELRSDVIRLIFSPDSKRLAASKDKLTSGKDNRLCVWDVATGRVLANLERTGDWPVPLAFSADGKLLAWGDGKAEDGILHLWDMSKDKELFRGGRHYRPLNSASFSSDGKLLASASWDGGVRLVEMATGKELGRFTEAPGVRRLAFSPDSRILASWCEEKGPIFLRDSMTGDEVGRLDGHDGGVNAVLFLPDGKTLATGSSDTTVLLWDVATVCKRRREPTRPLTAEVLETLWTDLASYDATQAYRAAAALRDGKAKSLPFLGKKLRRVVVDPALDRMIADLDDERFAVREKAFHQLEALDAAIEPALRAALSKSASAESARRIERLLAQCEERLVTSAETLRGLRAVLVLERIGTEEAKRIVQELAKGVPEARLTRDAQAALERWTR